MMTVRMIPPATGSNSITVNGRTYTAAVNSTIDVPDFDAWVMTANNWIATTKFGDGPTASRPANPGINMHYLDTDLNAAIVFDGLVWRNELTGAQV
jgi:hypothetical protein